MVFTAASMSVATAVSAATSPAAPAPVDLAPLAAILLIGAVLAVGAAAWAWRRLPDRADAATRMATRQRALAWLTLWLTFDLVVFGAFTRLTDSGLGCPDWPGCYASASPLGARGAIAAAATAAPAGPVTPHKAWIEMTHRYLATGVGALIAASVVLGWWARRRDRSALSPWWATAALVWVGVQGAFGTWTVTWKLYPLIVTAHLLGGLVLLGVLAAQAEAGRVATMPIPPMLSPALRRGALLLALASAVQIALGGWVSTNYAVLACADFPSCQGSLWPRMDVAAGFELLHELGRRPDGAALPFVALTAIHYVHRLGAYIVLLGMAALALALHGGSDARAGPRRRWAWAVAALAIWQLASGVSNVLLGWPLASALAHTAGAAAWVVLMTTLLMRASRAAPAHSGREARRLRPAAATVGHAMTGATDAG